MSVSYHPVAGQVALVEPEAEGTVDHADPVNRLIGVVAASDDALTILGVSSPEVVDGTNVVVSIFSAEGLYHIRATAHWLDGGCLAIYPIRDVELIQRRRWPRRPVHLDVTVSPAVRVDQAWRGVEGETLDLSVGGVRVATDRRLPPGTDLVVAIVLPDGDRLVARTKVVYSYVRDGAFEYRLAFDKLAEGDATTIGALVEAGA